MRASLTIDAGSLSEAGKRANEAFREFFGGDAYTITDESAESYLVDMAGRVLAWRCEFVGEDA